MGTLIGFAQAFLVAAKLFDWWGIGTLSWWWVFSPLLGVGALTVLAGVGMLMAWGTEKWARAKRSKAQREAQQSTYNPNDWT